MQSYQNIGGQSGISAYEAGSDHLRIEFTGGATYLYTGGSAGHEPLARMKQLADQGYGLNTYINQKVRMGYERRER